MPVDAHQIFHLEAVIDAALTLPPGAERGRIISEASRFLDESDDWPHPKMPAAYITDWIENDNPQSRAETLDRVAQL